MLLKNNMINGGNFTQKTQEALLIAQDTARQRGQQQVDALHLLYALLNQEESVVLTLLHKLGVDVESLKKKTEKALNMIPTVSTSYLSGQFYLTQDMAKVLERARPFMFVWWNFFGFIPFFSLFNIGWELGKLFSFCFSYQIVGFFVLGIFPHGVIELPAVIIANAWGLKLGLGWIKQPKGKKRKFIWSTLKEGVYISLGVALLLLIAAIIEGTLTPFLLSFY